MPGAERAAGWQEPRVGPRERLPRGRTFKRYPLAEVWAGGCRQPRASMLWWAWEQGQGQAPVT